VSSTYTAFKNFGYTKNQRKTLSPFQKVWLYQLLLVPPYDLFFPDCRILNFQKAKVVDFGKPDEGIFDDFQ
jgi:hypothetical protein